MIKFILIIVSIISSIAAAVHSETGWIALTPVTDHDLQSICFEDKFSGWAVGDNGIILYTTNGGSGWSVSKNDQSFDLTSIAVTSGNIYIAGDSGHVLRLIKGGSEWELLETGIDNKLMSICFVNSNTGFAAGFGGSVIKTTDGGNNWILLNTATDIQFNSVCFADNNSGWIAGYGGIYHTMNGGNSWKAQFIDGLLNLNSIYFADSINGWAAYYDNPTFGTENVRTTNAGLAWINHSMDNTYSLDMFFVSKHTGWSSCYFGKIMYSTNGGTAWTPQASGTGENLNSIFFIDSLNGWCAGDNGIILKTVTGGIITSVNNSSELSEMKFDILRNYPNPFNSQTVIRFFLYDKSDVSVAVYDVYGREVFREFHSDESPGMHEIKLNKSDLSSGVYYCRVTAGRRSGSIKLMLLK